MMLAFWVLLIIGLFGVEYLRQFHRKTRALEYQFMIFEKRDQLREDMMKGGVASANWVFQYLDSAMSKSIDILPKFTVTRTVLFGLVDRDERRWKECRRHLTRELEKPQNATVKKIYGEWIDVLDEWVVAQHWILLKVGVKWLGLSLAAKTLGDRWVKRQELRWKRSLEMQAEDPEVASQFGLAYS